MRDASDYDEEDVNELIDAYPGAIRIEDHAVGLTMLLTVMSPHDTSDASYLPAQSASVELDWAAMAQLRDTCDRALKVLSAFLKKREEREALLKGTEGQKPVN